MFGFEVTWYLLRDVSQFAHRNHLGMLPWDSVKPGQQSGDFLCQCSETGEI